MSSPLDNDDAAAAEVVATLTLTSLPLPLVRHIFSLLPVDCRLRCSEVCRGWRDVLLERSLWTRLDLSATSGVRLHAGVGALDALLRCAAARAGGGLQALQVDTRGVTHETLLEVAEANAGALRELHTSVDINTVGTRLGFMPAGLEALFGAAPLLRDFSTGLCAHGVHDVGRVLRNEAPFGPLRVRYLTASLHNEGEAAVVACAAAVAAHASLCSLELQFTSLDMRAALDAVVDAALTRHLHTVSFTHCGLYPASAPALARLLGSDALTTLQVRRSDHMLDVPAARVLAAALRANATLTALTLTTDGVFKDAAVAAELLSALTGHASLRMLNLGHNRAFSAYEAAAGAALGALVAANAPALTELDVSWCRLGDDGLRALFEALPANTHLRKLDCHGNAMSDACARDVLLPAVATNTSLRVLITQDAYEWQWSAARDAEVLVARRGGEGEAAA
jgi:hypothetical protein